MLIPKKASSCPSDADALAFLTAASISDPTICSAINQLVIDIKAASLWTNMKGLYPFVGGTAATCKWNLKDPRDLDAAFRLTFTASPTFSSNGVDWNGTTQYADTKFIPTSFTNTNSTIGYYSRENVSESKYDMGAYDGTNLVRLIALYAANGNTYGELNSVGGGTNGVVSDTRGLFTATRTGASANEVYRNATLVASPNTSAGSKTATYPIYIGTMNNVGTVTLVSTKQCAFAFIYDGGMNSTQVGALYTAIQAFETTLGRQV